MTLPVIQCLPNELDMQQVWAQVWELYLSGHQWWCSGELNTLLAIQQREHSEESPIGEAIASVFNINEPARRTDVNYEFKHLTVSKILNECGIHQLTKKDLSEARAYLDRQGFKQIAIDVRGYWITKDGKKDD